jgi:hypothetical protein
LIGQNPLNDTLAFKILSQAQNLYIAREMCWTFQVSTFPSYILQPRSDRELINFIRALAPRDDITFDTIVGLRGPVAAPELCNGLGLPVVLCDMVDTFTYEELVNTVVDAVLAAYPTPSQSEPLSPSEIQANVGQILSGLTPLLHNEGVTDAQRAVNFLITHDMDLYTMSWLLMFGNESYQTAYGVKPPQTFSFVGLRTQPQRLSGASATIDIILTYQGDKENTSRQYFTSVNVQGEFPYILQPDSGMIRYYNPPF